MSDLMFHDDEEAHREQMQRMREDYASWQRRPNIVDWIKVASLVSVIGMAAFFLWVRR